MKARYGQKFGHVQKWQNSYAQQCACGDFNVSEVLVWGRVCIGLWCSWKSVPGGQATDYKPVSPILVQADGTFTMHTVTDNYNSISNCTTK